MPVIIQCPSCEGRLKVSEEKRGKKVRCPKCEEVFKVDAERVGTKKRPDDDEEEPRSARKSSRSRRDEDEDASDEADDRDRDDDDERDEDRVRTKKKKKKKKSKQKQASGPWLKIAALAGGGIVVAGLLVWLVLKFTAGAAPAQPVTSWQKYASSEEQEFGFEFPDGWAFKGYGIKDKREVDIKGPGASINVKENLVGSLLGDIAGAGQGGQVDDDSLPVAKVHEMRRPKDSKTYKEKPGETVPARTGKVRRSEYIDGSKRGYRITVLLHQTALDVFCECRASDWATLKPAFEHVIASLGRGLPR